MKSNFVSLCLAALGVFALTACQQGSPATTAATTTEDTTTSNPKIVFVYADSIIANYTSFAEKQAALEKRQLDAENRMQSRMRSMQNEVQKIQQRIQRGELSANQIGQEQERLAGREQEILRERDALAAELQEELIQLNEELQSTVKKVMQELRDERGYDFILSYGQGTGLLMVNDALDVSDEVLRRLNNGEGEADSATSEPKDSTQ